MTAPQSNPTSTSVFERAATALGRAISVGLAPTAAVASALRNARVFHPRGIVLDAELVPIAHEQPWAELAERLAGPALVRLSAALQKSPRSTVDLLGCAVRLLPWEASAHDTTQIFAHDDTQDLLTVTSRTLVQLPVGLVTTNTGDYLANDYYGLTPFEVDGLGVGYFRLRGGHLARRRGRGSAWYRLAELGTALQLGNAVLRLEIRRRGLGRAYQPVAELRLRSIIEVDQEELAFSPYRSGRGIRPHGFINSLRRATYAASVLGRRWRREDRGSVVSLPLEPGERAARKRARAARG